MGFGVKEADLSRPLSLPHGKAGEAHAELAGEGRAFEDDVVVDDDDLRDVDGGVDDGDVDGGVDDGDVDDGDIDDEVDANGSMTNEMASALFACAHTAVDVVATTHQKTTKERRARMMKR